MDLSFRESRAATAVLPAHMVVSVSLPTEPIHEQINARTRGPEAASLVNEETGNLKLAQKLRNEQAMRIQHYPKAS
jgi:hypothetical protein